MAWTSDDQQVHKQLVVGGKLPSVGKSDDEKILGSVYVENGVHVDHLMPLTSWKELAWSIKVLNNRVIL